MSRFTPDAVRAAIDQLCGDAAPASPASVRRADEFLRDFARADARPVEQAAKMDEKGLEKGELKKGACSVML